MNWIPEQDCYHFHFFLQNCLEQIGQERFRTITTSYYKGAHGVIMVYDVTKRESFQNLESWLTDIKQYADANVGIILVGNKIDLVDQRQVATEEGQSWASKLSIPFLETSAKQAVNVEDAFLSMVDQIFKTKFENQITSNQQQDDKVVLADKPKKKKKQCSLI